MTRPSSTLDLPRIGLLPSQILASWPEGRFCTLFPRKQINGVDRFCFIGLLADAAGYHWGPGYAPTHFERRLDRDIPSPDAVVRYWRETPREYVSASYGLPPMMLSALMGFNDYSWSATTVEGAIDYLQGRGF